MSHHALREAVELAGSQVAFAKVAKTSQQIVSYWLKNGKSLPAEFVLNVEAGLGVPRYVLRPDIYPPAEEVAA